MKISRRQFLHQASAFTAGSIFFNPWTPALAQVSPRKLNQFFLYLVLQDGWDVTLGLDPQVHRAGTDQEDMFIEYRDSDITQAGNLKLAPAAQVLAPYASEISIINGISMVRDAGHESNRKYISTGNGSGKLPNYAVQFSICNHSAYGTIANKDVDLGSLASSVTGVQSLKNNLTQGKLSENGLADLLPDDLRSDIDLIEKESPIAVATFNNLKTQDSSFSQEVCTLAACFASGLAAAGNLSLNQIANDNSSSLLIDTHSDHERNHLDGQTKAWEMVAQIFKIFKSVPFNQSSLFDHTTFVVVSEFSRTPFLNAAKGKDHNAFTNSVLLAGKGIKGNSSVGQSHLWSRNQTPDKVALHTGLPIDFKTGQPQFKRAPGIEMIIPENVARTVLAAAGVTEIPPELESFKVLPNILK
jgi:hypothetical protein